MSGDRIEIATKSLNEILLNLPESVFFNVISFGSDYDPIYPSSVQATRANINEAV